MTSMPNRCHARRVLAEALLSLYHHVPRAVLAEAVETAITIVETDRDVRGDHDQNWGPAA